MLDEYTASELTNQSLAARMVGVVLSADERSDNWISRTLVGAGLKTKAETRKPMDSLIPQHLAHIKENVKSFAPESNSITTTAGRTIGYDSLVVATGIQINWNGINGLSKALADPSSGVSSIYSYDTCDKVWSDIDSLRSGDAIFTQPAGVVKCAGGPHLSCPIRLLDLLMSLFSTSKDHVDGLGPLPPD